MNRLCEGPRVPSRIDFGGEAGRATVERNGDEVEITFDRGMTAKGRFFDVPGRQEVQFLDLRFSTSIGHLESAPSAISIFTNKGRLWANLDRSLRITRGGPRVRFPMVDLQVERHGNFRLDE